MPSNSIYTSDLDFDMAFAAQNAPLTPDPVLNPGPKTVSSAKVFGVAAKQNIGGSVGGILGGVAVPALAGLAMGGPLGLVGGIATGLIGGVGGGMLGTKLQEAVDPTYEEDAQFLAEQAAAHKTALILGTLAPNAIAFRPSPSVIKQLASVPGQLRGLPGATLGETFGNLTAGQRAAMGNVALGGVFGAVPTAGKMVTGQPVDPEEAAYEIAAGLALHQPWGVGRMMGMHPIQSPDVEAGNILSPAIRESISEAAKEAPAKKTRAKKQGPIEYSEMDTAGGTTLDTPQMESQLSQQSANVDAFPPGDVRSKEGVNLPEGTFTKSEQALAKELTGKQIDEEKFKKASAAYQDQQRLAEIIPSPDKSWAGKFNERETGQDKAVIERGAGWNADTDFHEGAHGMQNDLSRSGRAFDNQLQRTMESTTATDKDYLAWKAEVDKSNAAGNTPVDPSVNEYLARELGNQHLMKILKEPGKWTPEDFAAAKRVKAGKASLDDLVRYTNNYQQHGPDYLTSLQRSGGKYGPKMYAGEPQKSEESLLDVKDLPREEAVTKAVNYFSSNNKALSEKFADKKGSAKTRAIAVEKARIVIEALGGNLSAEEVGKFPAVVGAELSGRTTADFRKKTSLGIDPLELKRQEDADSRIMKSWQPTDTDKYAIVNEAKKIAQAMLATRGDVDLSDAQNIALQAFKKLTEEGQLGTREKDVNGKKIVLPVKLEGFPTPTYETDHAYEKYNYDTKLKEPATKKIQVQPDSPEFVEHLKKEHLQTAVSRAYDDFRPLKFAGKDQPTVSLDALREKGLDVDADTRRIGKESAAEKVEAENAGAETALKEDSAEDVASGIPIEKLETPFKPSKELKSLLYGAQDHLYGKTGSDKEQAAFAKKFLFDENGIQSDFLDALREKDTPDSLRYHDELIKELADIESNASYNKSVPAPTTFVDFVGDVIRSTVAYPKNIANSKRELEHFADRVYNDKDSQVAFIKKLPANRLKEFNTFMTDQRAVMRRRILAIEDQQSAYGSMEFPKVLRVKGEKVKVPRGEPSFESIMPDEVPAYDPEVLPTRKVAKPAAEPVERPSYDVEENALHMEELPVDENATEVLQRPQQQFQRDPFVNKTSDEAGSYRSRELPRRINQRRNLNAQRAAVKANREYNDALLNKSKRAQEQFSVQSIVPDVLKATADKVERQFPEVGGAYKKEKETEGLLRGKLVDGPVQRIIKLMPLYRSEGRGWKAWVNDFLTTDSPDNRAVVEYRRALMAGENPAPLKGKAAEINSIVDDVIEQSALETEKRTGNDIERIPGYLGDVIKPEVLDVFTKDPTGPEAMRLKDIQTEYWKDQGMSEAEIANASGEFFGGFGKDKPNRAEQFGPVDKSKGYGLAPELRSDNLLDILSRTGRRYATRLAYMDHFENSPDTMAALKKAAPHKQVQLLMDDLNGVREDVEGTRMAIAGVIRAGMMQTMTGVNDFVTTFPLGMRHMAPEQTLKAFAGGLRDIRKNWQESFEMGVNRSNLDNLQMSEDGMTNIETTLNTARNVMNRVTGRNFFEQAARSFAYSTGKVLAWDAAHGGSSLGNMKEKFVKDFFPEGKASTDPEIIKQAAKRYVESVQGTYTYQGLPEISQKGSLAPYLSLSRWNIEQLNNFDRHVFKPALEGNYMPLAMATLGMVIGGKAVEEIRQVVMNRKSKLPTVSEILESEQPIKGTMYKAAGLAALAGYAGFYGDLARGAADLAIGNRPQEMNNPLLQGMGDGLGLATKYMTALADGQPVQAMELFHQFVTTYLQGARILNNQVSGEEMTKADKFRDLRVFKQLNHGELPPAGSETPNPFMRPKERRFKQTEDLSEAVGLAPELISEAIDANNPEQTETNLRRIKSNSYQTMPSPEHRPGEFTKFRDYLERTQGADEASSRTTDYLRRNAINKAKSTMIP